RRCRNSSSEYPEFLARHALPELGSSRGGFCMAQKLTANKLCSVTNPRYRPIYLGVPIILVAWLLAWAGHRIATDSRVTAAKIVPRVRTADLSKMSAEARAKWLADLAAKLNSLPPDERRKARLEHGWENLLAQMTEAEQSTFIEATMPAGFQQ